MALAGIRRPGCRVAGGLPATHRPGPGVLHRGLPAGSGVGWRPGPGLLPELGPPPVGGAGSQGRGQAARGRGWKGGPRAPFPLLPALPVLQTLALGRTCSQEKKTYEPTFLI